MVGETRSSTPPLSWHTPRQLPPPTVKPPTPLTPALPLRPPLRPHLPVWPPCARLWYPPLVIDVIDVIGAGACTLLDKSPAHGPLTYTRSPKSSVSRPSHLHPPLDAYRAAKQEDERYASPRQQ
ncbi:hypothetical protein FRC09_019799 [Ceratobasidium sp. 395]|nr:hypothetical protein FRC09_019799 [Ceratobasidium sp. 395]